jgi:hypothetical protein
MTTHILRVVVHGSFRDLDGDTVAWLRDHADRHAPDSAHFSREGHLTYDAHLRTFSFRYEVREQSDDAAEAREAAIERARGLAATWLDDAGVGHGELRVRTSDPSAAWRD